MLQDLVTFIQKIFALFAKSAICMNEKRDKKRLALFGTHLRATREGLGLSQDQVSANSDVTKGNLSMIESGKKDFTFTTLLEIAKGLNIHPKKLLDFELSQED
jgi:DNA-binding XRE family transcriptional regulator